MSRFRKVLAGMLMIILADDAMAAKPVIDYSNLAKNTVTAMQTQRQTVVQLQQYLAQSQDLILQVKNLQQLNPQLLNTMISRGYLPPEAMAAATGMDAAKAAAGVYANVSNAKDEIVKMHAILNGVNGSLFQLQKMAALDGTSMQDRLAWEARELQAGRVRQAKTYQELTTQLEQLNYHKARTDAIANALPNASGALQALQLNGAQMGIVTDQLSQLTQIQTTTAAAVTKQNIEADDRRLAIYKMDMITKARKCKMGISRNSQCAKWISTAEAQWPEAMK